MIKIALIDDSSDQIELFETIVKTFFDNEIKIVGSFTEASDLVQFLKTNEIDVLFSDVEMPNINGIELLELLEPFAFKVVMLTGYEKYAFPAIKKNVFDYFIKPINVKVIKDFIIKFKSEKIKELNNPISNNEENILMVNSHEKLVVIKFEDIVRLEAQGAYTCIIYDKNKSILSSKAIGFYEDILNNKGFYKIHRSHLINTKCIKEVVKSENDGIIMLNNDEKIQISNLKRKELVNLLTKK